MIQQPRDQGGQILIALPLDGSSPVPLVSVDLPESIDWDLRPNGSLAISLPTTTLGQASARIAVWNGTTGTAQWASPAEAGALHTSPVWSADGASIYYSALRPPDDLGFFRVPAAGGRATRIRPPDGNGGILEGITPDGTGLIWSRIQAGGSVEVFDLRSARNATFDPNVTAQALSWREAQPRALVLKRGCCAGPPVGTLYTWDDRAVSPRAIFGRELAPNDGVSSAAWDPDGTRIVAIVWDLSVSREKAQALALMNDQGGARVTIPDTQNATGVLWARSGIVYDRPSGDRLPGRGGSEIRLVDPAGGADQPLFTGPGVVRWMLLVP